MNICMLIKQTYETFFFILNFGSFFLINSLSIYETIWANLVPFQMCLSVCPYVSVCLYNQLKFARIKYTQPVMRISQLFVAARLIVIDKFGLLETFGKLFALRPMKLNPMFI